MKFFSGNKVRLAVLTAILSAEIIFLALTPKPLPSINDFAAVFSSALIELANARRAETKIAALKTSPLLNKAAQLKAEDMAKREYFSHNSPEGTKPWYWLDLVGYKYNYAGENLAINFTSPEDVNNAWMKSTTHRSNILSGKYTEVGVGEASGMYKGKEAVYIVQFFGKPASSKK